MNPSAHRRSAITVAIALALASICGCTRAVTEPATTGADPIPAINWLEGPPEDGDLDNPWTRAFREYLVVYAAAFNSRTLDTNQHLLGLSGEELRATYSEQDYRDEYMPGPRPVTITALRDRDESSVIVDVCAHTFWKNEGGADLDALMSVEWGTPQHWVLEQTDDTIRVIGTELEVAEDWGQSCSLDGVRYGFFNPSPFET